MGEAERRGRVFQTDLTPIHAARRRPAAAAVSGVVSPVSGILRGIVSATIGVESRNAGCCDKSEVLATICGCDS